MSRPPFIKTGADNDAPLTAAEKARQLNLKPGELPTPSSVAQLSDWMRAPGSTIWDHNSNDPGEEDAAEEERWVSEANSPLVDPRTNTAGEPDTNSPPQNHATAFHSSPRPGNNNGKDEPATPFTTNPSRAAGAVMDTGAAGLGLRVTSDAVDAPNGGSFGASGSGGGGGGFTVRDDSAAAQRIIASAALPVGMASLGEYISNGQPQIQYDMNQNANRNYPAPVNQVETAAYNYNNNGNNNNNFRGGFNRGNQQRFNNNNMNYNGGNQHQNNNRYNDPYHSNYGMGGNPNLGGNMGNNNNNGGRTGMGLPPPPRSNYLNTVQGQENTGNDDGNEAKNSLTALLLFHANFFPPPPPPQVPSEGRRQRAELWYHYASKWDVTQRLPPPPRSPLADMEREQREGVPRMTYVPYYGDTWLKMSERWFDVVQSLFDYPKENIAVEVDAAVVLNEAVVE